MDPHEDRPPSAACAAPGVNPDWWFHPDRAARLGTTNEETMRAKLICSQCPVWAKCWSLVKHDEYAIVAGTTAAERQKALSLLQLRENNQAKAQGRKPRLITIRSLPLPKINPAPKLSTRMQIAMYAFLKGGSLREAAEIAELPLGKVKNAFLLAQRFSA